jgi:hypothetical protein
MPRLLAVVVPIFVVVVVVIVSRPYALLRAGWKPAVPVLER